MKFPDLLSADLTLSYGNRPAILRDIRLNIQPGEIVGLVGHSGSGKSSLAAALLGLIACKGGSACGSVLWCGRDLLTLSEKQWRNVRGKQIAFVPQSPLSSLNPALSLRTQLKEAWKLHCKGGRDDGQSAIFKALKDVALPPSDDFLKRYPSEISVGQAQRFLIAMAILHSPQLLIADEPTSALDAITQAEILALFAQLNRERGTAILYISHDLLSVFSLCHRVALLYEGSIVECGAPQQVFFRPVHPFTQKLVAALPALPENEQPEQSFSFDPSISSPF
jgi:ABC-type glutathione transport system ATPase component